MLVTPYLFFDGRCEEALSFYRKAIGAELNALMRYKDCPEPLDPKMVPPGSEDRVMHASFKVGETTIMASDGPATQAAQFQGFALSLQPANPAEADRLFGALADGGQVRMPMGKTFFSQRFGMVTDRFGVLWMVYVPQAHG